MSWLLASGLCSGPFLLSNDTCAWTPNKVFIHFLLVSVETARVLLQSWWARLSTGASRQTHHDDHDDNGDEHAHADDDGDHDDDDDDDNDDDDGDDDDGDDGGDDDDNDADDEHDEDDGDGDRDGDGAGNADGGFDDDGDGDGRGDGGGSDGECEADCVREAFFLILGKARGLNQCYPLRLRADEPLCSICVLIPCGLALRAL